MKMERDGLCWSLGSITHPLHSYPAEFNNMNSHEPKFIFNDANLQPLLPLPYESDPSCFNFITQDFPSLPFLPQLPLPLPDLDFSLYSSTSLLLPPEIPDPDPDPDIILPHFLHSLQQPHRLPLPLPLPASSSSSSTPKLKPTRLHLNLSHSHNNPQTLDSIVQSYNSPPSIIPHSALARKRRQKLSDKTRCLQKLMPWDKKMDTGTMLQEAYKYIRFLQAQVSILQSMPITSSFASTEHISDPFGFGYAGLGRLNRQQLLQVLVNSPVAQTMLYSQGFCIFASEQLVSLNKAKERKTVLQQFLFGN